MKLREQVTRQSLTEKLANHVEASVKTHMQKGLYSAIL